MKTIDAYDIKPIYSISEDGTVYKNKKDVMKPKLNKDGYLVIGLPTINGGRTFRFVHQLVAMTYIGRPPDDMLDPTVDHIDENKLNNNYTNLRWIERNVNSSIRTNSPYGENNKCARLTEQQVTDIIDLLLNTDMSLMQIGEMFGVSKSTISNIKRKKSWKYITDNYDLQVKKTKTKTEREQQKLKIINLFEQNYLPKEVISKGFPETTVYRYYRQWKDN